MNAKRTFASMPACRLVVMGCGCAVLLAACAVGPNFTPPKPEVPSKWSPTALGAASGGAAAGATGGAAARGAAAGAASAIDTSAPDIEKWWSSFKDPALTSLIDRSLGANLDLREAVVRIEEARAQRQETAAGLWPTLAANASFTRQRFSTNTPNGLVFGIAGSGKIPGLPPGVTITNPFDQYQLGLSASWELDLFGRVRRSVEAAGADLQSAVENERDVQISLASDVAEAYIDLRGAQLRRSVVGQSVATQRDVLERTRERWPASPMRCARSSAKRGQFHPCRRACRSAFRPSSRGGGPTFAAPRRACTQRRHAWELQSRICS